MLPAGAVVVTLSLLVGASMVERQRPLWVQALQPLFLPLYDLPAQDVFYVIQDEFSPQVCWHWLMLGRRLQHGSESGSPAELAARATKPAYVAWVRVAPGDPPLTLPGYKAVAATPRGMLLRRM
jgi:hypothetical protein